MNKLQLYATLNVRVCVSVSMFLSAQCAATTGVIIHTHISFMTASIGCSCSGYSSDNISDICYPAKYNIYICVCVLDLCP